MADSFDLGDELFCNVFGDINDSEMEGMIKLEPKDLELEAEDLDMVEGCHIDLDSPHRHNDEEEEMLMSAANPDDIWSDLLTSQRVQLNDDPMMSEAGNQSSDHCYSQACQERQLDTNKQSNTTTHEKHTDVQSSKRSLLCVQTNRQEPKIITVRSGNSVLIETKSNRPAQSLLKQNHQLITSTHGLRGINPNSCHRSQRIIYPVTKIKQEPTVYTTSPEDDEVFMDGMPLTPPSSSQSSDSEGGGLSPRQSPPSSPVRQVLVARASGYRYNPATAIYSQPIPTSGVLRLTEEEKRTFISEGYPLPTKLPLSKIEERNLKKVRRKIKNKISAQESRRKKKEYMDQLEKKVDDIVRENDSLKRKCDSFETNNKTLVSQLNKLQQMLKKITPKQVTAQTGTCLLVMVLCFAVFVGNWCPIGLTSISSHGPADLSSLSSHGAGDHHYMSSSNLRASRTLLASVDEETNIDSEPWPIKLAKYSIQWTVQLINNSHSTLTSQSYITEKI